MSSRQYAAKYWASREPVRGRYAEHRSNPLRVADLLQQAYREGRPLKLIWSDTPAAGDELGEPESPTTLLPAVPADEFAGSDEDTEPNTVVREGQEWLRPEGFRWWPKALAG